MDPLKTLLDSKKSEIKTLKAEIKILEKDGSGSMKRGALSKKISKLEDFVWSFSPRYMEPRQIGSIVINYKLYSRFIKGLKGHFLTEEITEEALLVRYYKGSRKGVLRLNDLSSFFPEGSEFSQAELQEVSVL
ncbi:hypothetical protein [Pontibacillus litoralis]|uniref:Uncharacterized protein n=1 Tax=Pontibacillus litoralis JSM 072002 TaxID=1385512 RepID=A0A0A5HLI1_9BACI|nr:hypothetical protein [Pontibacillus litoralis]KGX84467.1 hypothetical protein N784_13470 [Pontibacillus litoralis JSM 072002]